MTAGRSCRDPDGTMAEAHRPTILFVGHFELGEQTTEAHLATVRDGRTWQQHQPADLAILVGDIGIGEKLQHYLTGGLEAVKEIYRRRLAAAQKCGAGCVARQLPKTEEELAALLDESQFRQGVEWLRESAPDEPRLQALLRDHHRYSEIIRTAVVTRLIAQRLKRYSLADTPVRMYSERLLRNTVAHRLDGRRKHNWLDIKNKGGALLKAIFETEIEKARGKPGCRGIMLALYETVAREGYDHVVEFYPQKHCVSLVNAQEVYQEMVTVANDPHRWKPLTFEMKLY